MKKHLANAITCCRILCSIFMLFFPAFSAQFYALYLFCGLSDMADGTIARKTNSISKFGARLDTVADIVFAAVSLFKFLPCMYIPRWLQIWIASIAIIKIGNILWGYATKKQFVAMHIVMNKLTGFLLFVLPLTLHFVELKYSFPVVCAIATFSAIQEGVYITMGREIV